MNHTSDQHEWFQRARHAPKGSEERNYYIWTDDPNKFKDARIIFTDYESSNWTWDPVAEQYYWHRFFHHQPDLNYDNPKVRKEIFRIIDYWLKMGVDGFRLDAIPYLFERENTNCENLPETHDFLKELRKYVDDNYDNVLLLAEANMWPEDSASYFGNGDECHMNYHFPIMPRMFMAVNMENRYPIMDIIDQTPGIPESCQWATFLRNHDELTLEMVTEEERDYMYKVFTKDPLARINLGIRKRLATLMDNDRRKIELMNVLLFSLPGTPVLYYGDEIGMGDNHYLGDRDGVRTPMQWDPGRNAGFSEANPQKLYLPVIIDPEYTYETVNVENQLENSNSMLWWMRRLIKMRKRFKSFSRGQIRFLESENSKVLIFIRNYQDEQILVAVNLSRYAQSCTVEMQEYKDLIPVEVFSQNQFEKIDNKPYVFTFAPYGYYWFKLIEEPEEESLIDTSTSRDILSINLWEDLKSPSLIEEFEIKFLLPYLKERIWFNPTGRKIESLKLFDLIPIHSKKFNYTTVVLIIQVNFFEGIYEKYRLVVSFTKEGEKKRLLEQHPGSIISRLVLNGEKGVLYDASYSPVYQKLLLHLLRVNRELNTDIATIKFDISSRLKSILEEMGPKESIRLIEARFKHVVIQYGKRFVIKLYRKIDRGTDRDVEITKYLSEDKGFQYVPRYLGTIEYSRKDDIKRTLAMIQEYVPNYGSARSYMSDALNRFYERVSIHGSSFKLPALQGSLLEPFKFENFKPAMQELLGGAYIEHIRLLAQRTAEMHLALGTDSIHDDFTGEDLSLHYQRSLFSAMKSLERAALDPLDKSSEKFPKNHQREINILLKNRPLLLKRLKQIYDHKIDADKIRPHGNYTLDSLLFIDGDFVITNFEGDLSYSLTERRLRKSPIVDIASILVSFHYVAYSALLQNEPSGLLAEHWYHHIEQIFLVNYLELVSHAQFIPEQEDFNIILETLLLEKYLTELELEMKQKDQSRGIIPVRGISKILGINDWLDY
jgi:maltose alpha-D-glucosyltransferase/alpha-amylase